MSRSRLFAREVVGRASSAIVASATFFAALSPALFVAAEEGAWSSPALPGADRGVGDWIAENCEIEVDGDVLRFVGGEGWVRYACPLGDFVFSGEYRPLKESKWDSGIYFRSPLPPDGKKWPERRQINLKQGEEGTLLGPKHAADQALIDPKEWRSFELTVKGKTATLKLNGQQAWAVDDVADAAGWLALQVEVPQGGEYEFRKLQVVELGMKDLFADGLDAWTAIEDKPLDCWKLEDGVLSCLPKAGPSLRTKERYGDFSLRLSYRLADGGNSGVYLRTPEDGDHHGDGAGIEVQLLHDDAEKYAKLKPYQYAGSLYGILPAERGSSRAAGEWNVMQIACEGTRYQVVLNGKTIVDASEADAPELAKRSVEGFLGLQHHGGGVDYRDVRVGPPVFAP